MVPNIVYTYIYTNNIISLQCILRTSSKPKKTLMFIFSKTGIEGLGNSFDIYLGTKISVNFLGILMAFWWVLWFKILYTVMKRKPGFSDPILITFLCLWKTHAILWRSEPNQFSQSLGNRAFFFLVSKKVSFAVRWCSKLSISINKLQINDYYFCFDRLIHHLL